MATMRLSSKGLKVLAAFLENRTEPLSGSDLYKKTGVGAGTIYPLLKRFLEHGWLECSWEAIDPSAEGRPRKRLYVLTPLGARMARSELTDVVGTGFAVGGLGWAN